MRWKTISVPGSYGDGVTVLTLSVVTRPRRIVLLLHGVHSWAQGVAGNKYAILGELLAELGVMPVLVETSRSERNRTAFGSDLTQWIQAAFAHKTFEQELNDTASALQAVQNLFPNLPLSLWGFSLGGLCALLLAAGMGLDDRPSIEGLILSGTGDRIRHERQQAMQLPILKDLGDVRPLFEAAPKVKAQWIRCFYGSEDQTFDEASCRRIHDVLPGDCQFIIVNGADHSFRMQHHQPSYLPLRLMVAHLQPLLTAPVDVCHQGLKGSTSVSQKPRTSQGTRGH